MARPLLTLLTVIAVQAELAETLIRGIAREKGGEPQQRRQHALPGPLGAEIGDPERRHVVHIPESRDPDGEAGQLAFRRRREVAADTRQGSQRRLAGAVDETAGADGCQTIPAGHRDAGHPFTGHGRPDHRGRCYDLQVTFRPAEVRQNRAQITVPVGKDVYLPDAAHGPARRHSQQPFRDFRGKAAVQGFRGNGIPGTVQAADVPQHAGSPGSAQAGPRLQQQG